MENRSAGFSLGYKFAVNFALGPNVAQLSPSRKLPKRCQPHLLGNPPGAD